MKETVKLKESQLRDIVRESIKGILLEYPYSPYPKGTPEYNNWLMKTFSPATPQHWMGKHPEWSEEQCEAEASKYDIHKSYASDIDQEYTEDEKSRMFPPIYLSEKAKSKSQQRFFGMVDAYKKGDLDDASPAVKKAAKGMTSKEVKDFAKTKHKGLPNHVDESVLANAIRESIKKVLK